MTTTPKAFAATIRHPITGKQIRLRARTERELQAYLHHIETLKTELRLSMRSVDDVDRALRRLQHGAVTVERAARAYAERADLANNTRRRVLSWLRAAGKPLAERELDQLDAACVSAWIEKLIASGAAKSSLSTAWRTLRSIIRFAAVRGWVGRVPWGPYRPTWSNVPDGQKRLRESARTVDELVSLLAAARSIDSDKLSSFLEAKIACTAMLGLRQGELAGLRWTDVDFDRFEVRIARQYVADRLKTPSSHATLRAPPELFAILQAQKEKLQALSLFRLDGPVFPSMHTSTSGHPRAYTSGECLSSRSLRSVAQAAHMPSVSRWTPHGLRDTFATLEAHARAGDLRQTADRTRHGSVASLLRYLRSIDRGRPDPGFTLATSETRQLAERTKE